MKRPTPQQTWIGLAFAVLSMVSTYLGYDKYEQSKVVPITTNNTTVIKSEHAHRSTESIQRMINDAVDAKMQGHEHGGDFHE